MKVYKYFVDPNKQEKWLNKMNDKGYKHQKSYGFYLYL